MVRSSFLAGVTGDEDPVTEHLPTSYVKTRKRPVPSPGFPRTIPRPRFRADSEDHEGGSFLPRCDRGLVEFGYVR
jgi:hypothetical protein